MLRPRDLSLCALLLSAGCAADALAPAVDGPDDLAVGVGKADGSAYTECELEGVVDFVNAIDIETDADEGAAREMLTEAGVHGSAAKCLVWYRLGLDTNESCPGGPLPRDLTVAPRRFESFDQIDDVRYVGPRALEQLLDASAPACDRTSSAAYSLRFSPVSDYADSHAAKIVQWIDDAESSVDVAIYSFSDAALVDALLRNADRVQIRVLYDKGHLGRGLEEDLEAGGIEVRFVGQTMHHKLAIFDGPHSATDDPADAAIATGTANWSGGAVDLYDELTVFIEDSPELALRYQAEFNHLWAYSQPVVGHDEIPFIETRVIEASEIEAADDPSVDAIFTSSNFIDRGGRLSVFKDEYDVASRWVELIENAEESIWLVQERLRSVPVAEALLRKIQENPDFEIRVYADNQEYVWPERSQELQEELAECYASARTAIQTMNCEAGMYYSYELHSAFEDAPNAELRLKYYAYNWHYTFPQMHQKSMIVDGRWFVTGSYNLSFNSEFNTFENVLVLDGEAHPEVVADALAHFDRLWRTGEAEGAYEALMDEVRNARQVPIQFIPFAMTWAEVDAYRAAVGAACGFSQLGQLHERARSCTRR